MNKTDISNNLYESLKCVWMSGNLVEYKLCDRNFDCDNCEFYKAMINSSHHKVDNIKEGDAKVNRIINKIMDDLGKDELNKNYIYLNNNLVVKNLFANTYYIGFSPVTNCLLDNCNSIEHFSKNEKVSKGESLVKLTGDWGNINISSPISFNFLGRISGHEILHNSEKWFGLIDSSKEELANASLSEENYMKDVLEITKDLAQVEINYPEVGTTMMDGGTEVRFLYQVIGKEKYIEILKKLFNKSGGN